MKKGTIVLCLVTFVLLTQAQSVSPEVVATAGDYYEGTNVSLSWTLGELATETYTNGNVILTQGFQQPFGIVLHGIDLDVLVYLEGPYQSGSMHTTLKDQNQIPLSQPYNAAPWFYTGTESVGSIPPNTVDWVLLDLRDATSAASAAPATSVEKKAAFLLSDGSVVNLDGSPVIQFTATLNNDPYIVVWHRNHLGILSANALSETGGVYSYDFSTSVNQAYGSATGYKLLETGVYGMAGGDTNGDGLVNNADKSIWEAEVGTHGYSGADHNMDGQVNNPDKNETWVENKSLSSQVPD